MSDPASAYQSGWVLTMIVQQREIKSIVEDSATLWQYAADELDRIRADALQQALLETGLRLEDVLPAHVPGTFESMLNVSFEPVEHPMLPLFKRTMKRKR